MENSNTVQNNQPTAVKSAALEEAAKDIHSGKFFPKLVFVLLGLIIAVELFIGAKTLLQPLPVVGKVESFQGGEISLVTEKASYKKGSDIPVSIRISTGGHGSDGSDINLNFDPTFLSASGNSSFTKGSIFNEYPIISIDSKKGTIRISGIVGPNVGNFNGVGNVGVINFKALKDGNTTISVDYQPNSTTHSTVIESGTAKNILDKVYNLDLNIGNSSAQGEMVCSNVRTYQMCRDSKGRIGTYWCSNIQDPSTCSSGCYTSKTGDELGCNVSGSE